MKRHRSHRGSHTRKHESLPRSDRLIEAGTFTLLIFTPLAYGTVEPWAEGIAGLIILGMAVTWVLTMLRQWELRIELPPGWLPALLFLGLIVMQTLALPSWLVGILSPGLATLNREALAFTGGGVNTIPLSLDPDATARMMLKFLALALFFLVTYNTYRTQAQVRRAVWVMIGTGTLLALFGIVQRMTWNGRLYWVGPEAPHSAAFGPFVNRTHFAGLMVVIVPMALGLLLAGRRDPERRRHRHDWRMRLRAWNSRQAGPTSLIPWLVLLMGGAALVSGSRGGVVALLAALLVMVGLGSHGPSGGVRVRRIAFATGLIVLSAIWIGSDVLFGTVERLVEEVGQPEGSPRLLIWADALQLWTQFPSVGTGLATFEVAFPLVRTLQAPVTFTHAESDWVQLLTDTGSIGMLLALLSCVLSVLTLLRYHRAADRRWTRAFTLAGLVALVGAALQGIANFNLLVTSNFLYLAVAVALTLRVSTMSAETNTLHAGFTEPAGVQPMRLDSVGS